MQVKACGRNRLKKLSCGNQSRLHRSRRAWSLLSSARSSLNNVGLGKPWKDWLDLSTKAPAMPDRKRYSIKRSITAGRLRRGFHKGLNAEKQAHDSTRSIFLEDARLSCASKQAFFFSVLGKSFMGRNTRSSRYHP